MEKLKEFLKAEKSLYEFTFRKAVDDNSETMKVWAVAKLKMVEAVIAKIDELETEYLTGMFGCYEQQDQQEELTTNNNDLERLIYMR
jgi:hypothetical protein